LPNQANRTHRDAGISGPRRDGGDTNPADTDAADTDAAETSGPSIIELSVPYQDTGAADLGWSLDLGSLTALAVRRVVLPQFTVELRLLGASHQVLISTANDPIDCVETVACLPAGAATMPARAERSFGRWQYRFTSVARSLRGPAFDHGIAEIDRATADATASLTGRYPGLPGALTAVAVEVHGPRLRWHTWHTYPQGRQIVTTIGSLSRVPRPR
jgi:hypothetical protein